MAFGIYTPMRILSTLLPHSKLTFLPLLIHLLTEDNSWLSIVLSALNRIVEILIAIVLFLFLENHLTKRGFMVGYFKAICDGQTAESGASSRSQRPTTDVTGSSGRASNKNTMEVASVKSESNLGKDAPATSDSSATKNSSSQEE